MAPPVRRGTAGLLFCVCLCCGLSVVANASKSSAPVAEPEEPAVPFAFSGFDEHPLVGRRLLFGFSMPNVGGMVDSAVKWAEGAAGSVSSMSGGLLALPQAAGIFNNASVYVEQGLQVARAAWDSMTSLAQRMTSIFTDFSPLKPIFADKNGLMQLLMPANMQTLVGVVRNLVNTTSVLRALSSALNRVSEMFTEFQDLFGGVLQKLNGGSTVAQRRLAGGYMDLLRGIDFEGLLSKIKEYLGKLSTCVVSLTEVQDVLGPLMMKLQGSGGAGRRLFDLGSITGDQQRYASAISKIVPTWKVLEGTGIELCPKVLQVKDTAASLKCRVTQFAASSVLPTWASGMVAGVVDQCGSQPASNPTESAVATAGCPASPLSAGIEDLLGQNSNQLGWVLAVLGFLGIGGTCGLVGTQAMKRRKVAADDSSDDGTDHEHGLKGHE